MEQSIVIEENVVQGKKTNKTLFITTGIIIIILIIGYISIKHFNDTYIYNGKISENIYIQGVNVSGLDVEEAKKVVSNKYTPKEMSVNYEDKNFIIKPEDIEFTYNINEVVSEAYNYTKTDSYFQNLKRFFALEKGEKQDFKLESIYSDEKLNNSLKNISKDVNSDVVNAKLYISGSGGKSITPSQIGIKVDIAKNKEILEKSITEKDFKKVNLVVKETEPRISTDMVSSVNSVLATHTTDYSKSSEGRKYNIEKSAKSTSDILLMPGEVYSYNDLTGIRSESNGYKNAPVIVNGELEDGIGGGVCQVSTTIYNSVLYSGLDITEVRNHSLPSNYAEMGKDATVANGYLDLKFKNPYNTPIYIKNTTYNGKVTSTIYGNSSDKKKISIKTTKNSTSDKYIVKTYRETKNYSGKVVNTEYIATSTYKRK